MDLEIPADAIYTGADYIKRSCCFMTGQKLPQAVYHYTSADGLHGILSSGILYFTDSLFLNDRSERKNFYSILKSCLKDRTDSLGRMLMKRYFGESGYIFRSLTDADPADQEAERYFVLSCCREKDSLPMWNNYTRSMESAGYNIHFDLPVLLKQLEQHPMLEECRVLCSCVIYNEAMKREAIRQMLNQFACRQQTAENEEVLFAEMDEAFDWRSLFYKEQAFSHEKEIRIVIPMSNRCIYRRREEGTYQFRKVRGVQVPCLALDVLEKGTAITGVTAGPALDKEMAVKGVEYMLYCYGFPQTCKVSSVPLRY